MHLSVSWLIINSSVWFACQEEMQTGMHPVTWYVSSSPAGASSPHCVLSFIILLTHIFSRIQKITHFWVPKWEFWHYCCTTQNLAKENLVFALNGQASINSKIFWLKKYWLSISGFMQNCKSVLSNWKENSRINMFASVGHWVFIPAIPPLLLQLKKVICMNCICYIPIIAWYGLCHVTFILLSLSQNVILFWYFPYH